jgi:hypothetical protein
MRASHCRLRVTWLGVALAGAALALIVGAVTFCRLGGGVEAAVQCPPNPPKRDDAQVTLDPSSGLAGASFNVAVEGMRPYDTAVEIYWDSIAQAGQLHSGTKASGATTYDADVDAPDDATVGEHSVIVCAGAGASWWYQDATFEITALPATPTPTPTPTPTAIPSPTPTPTPTAPTPIPPAPPEVSPLPGAQAGTGAGPLAGLGWPSVNPLLDIDTNADLAYDAAEIPDRGTATMPPPICPGPAQPVDLSVTVLEVTQAVQTPPGEEHLALVTGRTTIARVAVHNDAQAAGLPCVCVRLYIEGDAGYYETSDACYFPPAVVERNNIEDTLQFSFVVDEPQEITLTAWVDPMNE